MPLIKPAIDVDQILDFSTGYWPNNADAGRKAIRGFWRHYGRNVIQIIPDGSGWMLLTRILVILVKMLFTGILVAAVAILFIQYWAVPYVPYGRIWTAILP